jgi:hypothetical protein
LGLATTGGQKPIRQTHQEKETMQLDTDAVNGIIQVIVPRNDLHIKHLRLDNPDADNPDADNPDAAEYRLLEQAMDNTRIDV